jgi:peroxiredoxin Q/BCP
VQVLGVSTDDVEANARFARENEFSYPLLCDTERTICVAYGACESSDDQSAKRITYVIGPGGAIAQAHAEVDARKQPEELTETL